MRQEAGAAVQPGGEGMSQGMERSKVTFGDTSRGWVIFLSLGFAAPEVLLSWGVQHTASHAWRFPTHGACEGRRRGSTYQTGGDLPSRGQERAAREPPASAAPTPIQMSPCLHPRPQHREAEAWPTTQAAAATESLPGGCPSCCGVLC